MSKIAKIFAAVFGAVLSLFAVTFTIYFFNLDMKFMALIEPLLLKHYDNMPRNRHL